MVEHILAALERCRKILPRKEDNCYTVRQLRKGPFQKETRFCIGKGKYRTAMVALRRHPQVKLVSLRHGPSEKYVTIQLHSTKQRTNGANSRRGKIKQMLEQQGYKVHSVNRGEAETDFVRRKTRSICTISYRHFSGAVIKMKPSHAEAIVKALFDRT